MNNNSMQFKEELVERLRKLIRHRGQSIAMIERQLGKRRGYIAEALRGKKILTVDLILEVLHLLRVDPRKFFSGDVIVE